MLGVKVDAYIVAEDAHDVDNNQFLDEFIEWVESKGLQCTGSFGVYDNEAKDEP